MMRTRFFLWLALFPFLLVGCKQAPQTQQPDASGLRSVQKTLPVAAFSKLVVDGTVDVHLRTGYKHPEVIVRGAAQDMDQLDIVSQQGVLLIKRSVPSRGKLSPVHVEVRATQLREFRYRGRGVISGKRVYADLSTLEIDNAGSTTLEGHLAVRKLTVRGDGVTQLRGLKSPHMQMNLGGQARVQVAGEVNVASIDMHDSSYLSVYWVKSNTLKLNAHQSAVVQLAGVADRLEVELFDQACFKGRHLRAGRSFVKTHNQSSAEISTVRREHTLSTDASSIYFYNIAELRSGFMASNGATLDMRDWNMPFIREYNAYNR